MTKQGHTIEKLHIYQTSRQLEDQIHELVKQLPSTEYYSLGDQLRRTSAATTLPRVISATVTA
jgi:hypothetical protein